MNPDGAERLQNQPDMDGFASRDFLPPNGPALGASRFGAFRMLLVAVVASIAAFLGLQAWERNLAEACRLNEWPYLSRCEKFDDLPHEIKVERLRSRVEENPGDSLSWVALAWLSQEPGGLPGMDVSAVVATASRLAPQHGAVLRLQAKAALKEKRWPDAISALTRLSQFHNFTESSRTLARLVGQIVIERGLLTSLLEAVKKDGRWLERVLRHMPREKVPMAYALPLVSAVIETRQLSPAIAQFVIRQLKAEGLWLEAHGVWLELWNRPVGLLFNGDFEQAFLPYGFDWEVTDNNPVRAGARVYLSGRGDRGQVMQVVFNGKAMAQPVVRQHLILVQGAYRFSGEYQSSDLRSSEGLSWVLSCATGGKELARTPPVQSAGRNWQRFDVDFAVPADCGLGVSLSLRTQALYEAKTGMRGEVLFDRFSLTARE